MQELNEGQKRAQEMRDKNLRSKAQEKIKEKQLNNKSNKEPSKNSKKGIKVVVVLIILSIIGYFTYNSFPSVKNQKSVDKLFIKETGENIKLKETARNLLKYPETYEHKKTIRQVRSEKNIFIQTNFTGKNGFNVPERFCLEMMISQSGAEISSPIMCDNMDLN